MGTPSRIADYVTLGTSPVEVPEGSRLDVLSQLTSAVTVTIAEERGSSVTVSVVGGGTLAIAGRAYVTPGTAGLIAHYARVGDAPTWGSNGPAAASVGGAVTYLGAGASPATGVWTVAIQATTTGSPIQINGSTVYVGIAPANIQAGTVYIVSYPITAGITYAVGGGTAVSGTVGP
jgi:hypothetical protein